jgi:hypothetical protein
MAKALSLQERKFVAEYLVDMNTRAAGERAGGSPLYGSFQMRKPHVRAALERALRRLEESCTFSSVRVLEEAARIALADPRQVVAAGGQLKSLEDMDEDTARAVSSLKVTVRQGKKDEPPEVVTELKFWDKNSAINTILKSLGKDGERAPVTIGQVTVGGGATLEDKTRLRGLENQLRSLLGKDLLPEIAEVEEADPELPEAGPAEDEEPEIFAADGEVDPFS